MVTVCSPVTKKPSRDPILLVANKHSNTLSFVDPVRFKVIETIPVGPNPHEIVVTPDQRYAYLTNYAPPGNTISLVDLVRRKHVMQISTGEYSRIHGCGMASDGKNAYFTAGQSGYIVEIDTRTNQVTRSIPTHGKISHMVYISPDNNYLYTANIVTENVSVIDRKTGDLIRQIPCGKGVEGMAFTPDGKYLWAANQTGGTITIIEIPGGIPVKTFDCPGMPVRIKFTRDGKLALVAGWVEEGVLTIIDVASLMEIKRIRVGDFAIGIELTPDGKHAFVGCEDPVKEESVTGGSNTGTIPVENSKGIHVIDMQTLSVVKVIKTGMGPDPMVMWFPPE